MIEPVTNDASQNDRLDEILAGYLESEQSGQRLDRQRLLAENADLADELRAFFADHDRMKAVAEPLRVADAPKSESAAEEATLITHHVPASTDEEPGLPLTKADAVAGQRGKDSSPEPGSIVRYFGDYELLSEVARGGMGVVYKARQVKLNRIVALKMILSGQFASPIDVQRFHSEAEAAAQLDHVGIVPIYEVGEYEGHHFFTMGFVDGGSLSARLRDGPLPPRDAAELVQRIAEAVQYAHERGVIHRDLKPANVLLDRHGQPRITDFGLAKNIGHDSGLTASGQIMGTPGYMPPEQAAGHIQLVGETADIYSLGAVLYALLTGRPPFQADNMLDTLKQVIDKEPVSPAALNARVPLDLETICLKCLEKDRQRRYVSAAALADDLGRFLRGEPIAARPVSRVERTWRWAKRKPVLAGLMAAVAVLIVTVVVVPSVLALRLNVARQESDRHADEAKKNQKTAEENENTANVQRREAEKQTGIAKAQEKIASEEKLRADREAQDAVKERDEATVQRNRARDQEALAKESRDVARRHLYGAHMLLSRQEWEGGRVASMRELLARYRPRPGADDPRGWEWYYLTALLHRDRQTLRGHGAEVKEVAWSPQGNRLASASLDRTIIVWDVATGEKIHTLRDHAGAVYSVAWSPDGNRLASASHDQTVKIWEPVGGTLVATLKGHEDVVRKVVWSPDGQSLASAGHDKTIHVWDVEKQEVAFVLRGHRDHIWALAWSPNGEKIASGCQDNGRVVNGSTMLWDVKERRQERSWDDSDFGSIRSVAWSADSQHLASATGQQSIRVCHPISEKDVAALSDHKSHVTCVAWGPGDVVASASYDETIKIWNFETRKVVATLSGHLGAVHGVAWSPDGKRLASAGADGLVKIWDPTGAAEAVQMRPYENWVCGLSWHPDGRRLATAYFQNPIDIWDVQTGESLLTLTGHTARVTCAIWSPDGSRLASASYDRTVRIWDAKGGPAIHVLHGHPTLIWNLAWSPDGQKLASAGKFIEDDVYLWDATNGKALGTLLDHKSQAGALAWSPDSRQLATGTGDGKIRVWDVATLKESYSFEAHTPAPIRALDWSRDGRLISGDGESAGPMIAVWDLATRKRLSFLRGYSGWGGALKWSPDGKRFVSAGGDGTIRVRDGDTGAEVLILPGHFGSVAAVAWSNDGRSLATGGTDFAARVWDASAGYNAHQQEVFAVLPRDSQTEEVFSSLTGAVAAAHDGDTIEVRGNASVYGKLDIGNKAITVRAAPGIVPVLNMLPSAGDHFVANEWGFHGTGSLTLEGLVVQAVSAKPTAGWEGSFISVWGPVRLAHCRFQFQGPLEPIGVPLTRVHVHSCLFILNGGTAGIFHLAKEGQAVFRNNVMAGGGLGFTLRLGPQHATSIQLERNTIIGRDSMAFYFRDDPDQPVGPEGRSIPCQLAMKENLFDPTYRVMSLWQQQRQLAPRARMLLAPEAERYFRTLLTVNDQQNLFRAKDGWLVAQDGTVSEKRFCHDLSEWNAFWKLRDTQSVQGAVQYQVGDVFARLATDPGELSPQDFFLHPESAGKGIGPGGGDLGADIDQVGPGLAYERWRLTPEYEVWLRDDELVRFLAKVRQPMESTEEILARLGRDITRDPKDVAAWRGRAAAYCKVGYWDQALSDFTAAIALAPNDTVLWLARGDLHGTRARWEEAIADYSQALKLQPDDWKTLFGRSEAYHRLNQPDKALADIASATALNPTDPDVWVTSFRRHLNQHKSAEAIAAFEKGVEMGAMLDHAVRHQVSATYRAIGDLNHTRPEVSLEAYRKGIAVAEQLVAERTEACEYHAELFANHRHRGIRLFHLGREQERDEHYSQAVKSARHILELARTDELARVRFNHCILAAVGPNEPDLSRWRDLAEEAVKFAPQDPDCWRSLGQTRFRLGEWETAIDAYRKSVDLRPAGDGQTWFHLAMAEWQLNNKDQAGMAYERGIEWMETHNPDPAKWPEVLHLHCRSEASALLGRTLEELDRNIAAKPNDPAPRLARARHFSQQQKWEPAEADYSEVLKRTLDDPAIWSERANLYVHLGQNDKALGDYGEAIRLKPQEAWNWGRRGRTYMVLSQWDKATADIEQAIKLESPVGEDWYWYVLLRLHADKTDDYRAICTRLLDRFGETKEGWAAISMARAWSLAPAALADPKHAVRLAEFVMATDPKSGWHQHVLGLAHHRAGQHAQAIHSFRESLAVQWPEPLNWLGLALAHHGLGQPDAAREWFTKADQWYEPVNEQYSKSPPGTPAPYAHHWLEIQLLYREAKKLIK